MHNLTGIAGLFTVYLYLFFSVRLLGPLRDVNFTVNLTQAKELPADLITYISRLFKQTLHFPYINIARIHSH